MPGAASDGSDLELKRIDGLARFHERRLGLAEVARRRFKVDAEEYDDIVFALPLA